MTRSDSDLRSKLSKARGLGAAHHGTGHWIWQRATAVALIAMLPWFVYSLLTTMLSSDVGAVARWVASPVNAVVMILMLASLFAHAKLGLQVVIEDYVHGNFSKYTLLLLNGFFCYACAAVGVLAVLRLHFLDIAAGNL